ncbi:hypothetical protein IHE55_04070 [Streptomyces pactum]|uniref:Uncharacterized protein n=1 Tax=Streptomyces pactum TaxID=68249 RepID=A0ABS0NFT7_9ACTN|nr:hypothetical protein [Streptomyces pactum]MBH5334022.1 hypothetical protein [Streptomyces pactum]
MTTDPPTLPDDTSLAGWDHWYATGGNFRPLIDTGLNRLTARTGPGAEEVAVEDGSIPEPADGWHKAGRYTLGRLACLVLRTAP